MKRSRELWQTLVAASLTALALAVQAETAGVRPRVVVEALFPHRAVIQVNGVRRVIGAGQRSPDGVKLLEADSRKARFEVDGERFELGLNERVDANFRPPDAGPSVKIVEAGDSQFYVDGEANGNPLRLVVDTGAAFVSVNSRQAARLGLLSKFDGTPVTMSTASGLAQGYRLKLRTLRVQGLLARDVDCVVMDGDFPEVALLGQSFLNRFQMTRVGPLLTLQQR
jgi:aspartyl protease family protein